jgi:GNAT superfamily N-acetyltransferase
MGWGSGPTPLEATFWDLAKLPMKSADLRVRVPSPKDAPALAALVTQLGYPAPAEVMPDRLEKLLNSADSTVLVAEDAHGAVVGLMTARVFPVIHLDAPMAWLTALVVLESARGRGVGSLLLDRAENWAIQKGAHKISLTSAMHRTETHVYYDNRGYERSGLRFTKKLAAR